MHQPYLRVRASINRTNQCISVSKSIHSKIAHDLIKRFYKPIRTNSSSWLISNLRFNKHTSFNIYSSLPRLSIFHIKLNSFHTWLQNRSSFITLFGNRMSNLHARIPLDHKGINSLSPTNFIKNLLNSIKPLLLNLFINSFQSLSWIPGICFLGNICPAFY